MGATVTVRPGGAEWGRRNRWCRQRTRSRGLECRQAASSLPGAGLEPSAPPARLLPSAGRSQEGCTRGCPFKSASLRLRAAQAEGPQLLRRHQSRPPGPDPVAGGAGESGGRQVWANSPFIPRLGRRGPPGGPAAPAGRVPTGPGEGRGCGGAVPGRLRLGTRRVRASILAGLCDLGPVAALLCASASPAALLPAQEALALGKILGRFPSVWFTELVGCRLRGRTESDTTEATQQQQQKAGAQRAATLRDACA